MLDVINGSWADELYPLVSKWFDDKVEDKSALITTLIGKESTNSIDVREQAMGGIGTIPDYDGTVIPELTSTKGFQKIYTPKEKAAKYSVQYKYAKVDKSGEAKKAGTRMATALTQTQIRGFYDLFANGFGGNIGADGKALFASDHPVSSDPKAGTYSNLLTDTFSISAITKAQTLAQRFKTFDGLDFDCDMNVVLVSPELEPKCREFFGKEAKLIPQTSENGANPLYDMSYFVIKGFSAKQWAVADREQLKEMFKMVYITAPMVIPQKAPNPLVQEYIGYMDYTFGYSDPRVILGSNPA